LKVYTVKQLSKLLGMTELSVRKYIREGKIKGVKAGGKWLVSEYSLNEFFQQDHKNKK